MITKKLTPKGWEITETTEMEETEHARSNADNSGGNAEPAADTSDNPSACGNAILGLDSKPGLTGTAGGTSSKLAEPGKRSSNGRSRHTR